MNFDAQRLYELLPAIYRICDAANGEPLKQFLGVLAEQIAVLEEDLDQLYDDQFIETCADWVVPYIGDLIGYRALNGSVPGIRSPRDEVAKTIALRRRKGTAVMLNELARDVTGWPARAVEFFQLLSTTQYMNHLRPQAQFTADLRSWEKMARVETAFDTLGHTVCVRRIPTRAGRHNIPNVGIFLWRIQSYRIEMAPASSLDSTRYLFNSLGIDAPLYARTAFDERMTHVTGPLEVPDPIGRLALHELAGAYYGPDKSFEVFVDGALVPVVACDLSDDPSTGTWNHTPRAIFGVDPILGPTIGVDPVLGRIALVTPPLKGVEVTYHYGFGADIGGGPYARAREFAALKPGEVLKTVSHQPANNPDFTSIQAALSAVASSGGVVEILDNGVYAEKLHISLPLNKKIELRAAEGFRPTLMLDGAFTITGAANTIVTLNGLLIAADPKTAVPSPALMHVPNPNNALAHLTLRHCTLVPGLALKIDGTPRHAAIPCLGVKAKGVQVDIERSIVGAVRVHEESTFSARDTIIDATDATKAAYAAPDHASAGGNISLNECTVIGKIHADIFTLVSNCILRAALAPGDAWKAPVWARRKQEGCVRFSWLPHGAIVPRRYRCQPAFAVDGEIARIERDTKTTLTPAQRDAVTADIESSLVPAFAALRYGRPDYAWLLESVPREIREGADDESEMGAFHLLYQPQREANLRERLEEYLRLGLEAGIFTA